MRMTRQARNRAEGVTRAWPAMLVAGVMAACNGDATSPQPERSRALRQQAPPAPPAPDKPGDPPPPLVLWALLIVDQDAGAPLPEGGRAGGVFVAHTTDMLGVFSDERLSLVATDPRWVDPADALQLPDGSLLLLESKWAPDGGEARGAIFRLTKPDAPPELWWTDARTRQPVALVRDGEGTIFVSDRDADPDGVRSAEPGRQRTGCVFGIEVGADGKPARTEVVAAGPALFTPGALLSFGPLLMLMDADANPRGLRVADGRLATPGVLFDLVPAGGEDRLARRRVDVLSESEATVSPVCLVARSSGQAPQPPASWSGLGPDDPLPSWLPELFLVDANFGTTPDVLGDGALFWVRLGAAEPPSGSAHGLQAEFLLRVDPASIAHHSFVDPAYGCVLPGGGIAIADASADPLHLGADGTGKGVYGSGHGAILVSDPAKADSLRVMLASERFVTPVAVRVMRP